MLFTYARYFAFTFTYLLVVQVHSFRLIHHYKPDLIYLDASLQRPSGRRDRRFDFRQIMAMKGPKYRT